MLPGSGADLPFPTTDLYLNKCSPDQGQTHRSWQTSSQNELWEVNLDFSFVLGHQGGTNSFAAAAGTTHFPLDSDFQTHPGCSGGAEEGGGERIMDTTSGLKTRPLPRTSFTRPYSPSIQMSQFFHITCDTSKKPLSMTFQWQTATAMNLIAFRICNC